MILEVKKKNENIMANFIYMQEISSFSQWLPSKIAINKCYQLYISQIQKIQSY